MYLGCIDGTGETIIGTPEGVVKARDFRRKTINAERWNGEFFNKIKGTPWEPNPGREGDYNIKPRIILPEAGPVSIPARGRDADENITRRSTIHKQDLIKYGYQQGCLGCKMAREGKPAQSHNETCRKRIEEAINKDKAKDKNDQNDKPQEQRSSDKRPSQEEAEESIKRIKKNEKVNIMITQGVPTNMMKDQTQRSVINPLQVQAVPHRVPAAEYYGIGEVSP